MRLWFQETAVFWVFGFVSAQFQGFQTCAFAKTSPKTKNPRCPSLYLFCQCSSARSIYPKFRSWNREISEIRQSAAALRTGTVHSLREAFLVRRTPLLAIPFAWLAWFAVQLNGGFQA